MGNTWFNIRFGTHHFMWGPGSFRPWCYNGFHERDRRTNPHWKWFVVYCLFGKHL